MTIRNAFENILVELNKVQAPSLLLDDFIYLFNKGVQEYINERYNLFESKQQLTDDLRVLVKTVKIPTPTTEDASVSPVFGVSYPAPLPEDYLHILNCICEFEDLKPSGRCPSDSTGFFQGANKLNTNQWSHVINNYYLRPSIKQPYYYIVNINEPAPGTNGNRASDDLKKATATNQSSRTDYRYGNPVLPIMQIKCGDDPRYKLKAVYVDYLRAPIYYALDQDQLDAIVDTTQVIEFPDYVTYEVINRIVRLILENGKDPRMQTHTPVNTSIA